jgi:hypothetical protein
MCAQTYTYQHKLMNSPPSSLAQKDISKKRHDPHRSEIKHKQHILRHTYIEICYKVHPLHIKTMNTQLQTRYSWKRTYHRFKL